MIEETDPKAEENEPEGHPSVPTKAKEIGQSLKEKVKSVGMKTEEKTKELINPCRPCILMHIGPANDAHDIQALGSSRIEKITADFENTMSEIENESDYDMQEKQLTAYKKLLEEQM